MGSPSLLYWGPSTGHSTPEVSATLSGGEVSPWHAGSALFNATQEAVCWFIVIFQSSEIPRAFSPELSVQPVDFKPGLPGFIPLQGQKFALSFAGYPEVPVGPLLHPTEVPLEGSSTIWCYQPHLLVLSGNLQSVHSVVSCRSLIKALGYCIAQSHLEGED